MALFNLLETFTVYTKSNSINSYPETHYRKKTKSLNLLGKVNFIIRVKD